MSTGKQLSFMSGEVSPALQFNSNEVSYATGLRKAKNAYVRKEGGISNRPGFLRIHNNPQINSDIVKVHGDAGDVYNFAIKGQGNGPSITSFTFWNGIDKRYDILEMGYFDNSAPAKLQYRYNFSLPADIDPYIPDTIASDKTCEFQSIERLRFVATSDRVVIFPYITYRRIWGATEEIFPINISFDLRTKTFRPYGLEAVDTIVSGISKLKSHGLAPFLPVSYLFTLEKEDRYEYIIGGFTTPVTDITAWNSQSNTSPGLWYPHAQCSTMVEMSMEDPGQNFKGGEIVRIYRSAWGKDPTTQFYKLVTIGTFDLSAKTLSWQDYGAEDATFTPPIRKKTIVPIHGEVFAGGFPLIEKPSEALAQAVVGAHHQLRLHVFCEEEEAFTDADTVKLNAADANNSFMASKLNCDKQFTQPLIFRPSEAFTYDISAIKNSKKVAMLSMKRLCIFTTSGVTILRGGLEGSLTPTELNPEQISGVGCHEVVEPKMAGDKGYYLSSDSSRLMGLAWTNEGQCKIFEASTYSSHLLEGEEFIRMEVVANKENSVFLLTSMGKLIHITFNNDLVAGFSSFELSDGYIENIVTMKTKDMFSSSAYSFKNLNATKEVLGAYVIRNGVRSFEMLVPREDVDNKFMMFMDSAQSFGVFKTKIEQTGELGTATYPLRMPGDYPSLRQEALVSPNQATQFRANIGNNTVTDWTAGQTIPVYIESTLDTETAGTCKIDFYYEEGGERQTLRGEIQDYTSTFEAGVSFENRFDVVFERDVPVSLRNVFENSDLSPEEKNKRYTNYAFAYNYLPQDVLREVYSQRPASIPLGDPLPVALYADSWTVSSPLNPDYVRTGKVTSIEYDIGTDTYSIDLNDDFYAFGFIGLPYEMEVQTLPVEASDERTLKTGKVIVNSVGLGLLKTMGGFAGIPDTSLADMAPILTKYDDPYEFIQMPKPYTGYEDVSTPSEYNEGIVAIKHVDPLPFTLLSVYPKGRASN